MGIVEHIPKNSPSASTSHRFILSEQTQLFQNVANVA